MKYLRPAYLLFIKNIFMNIIIIIQIICFLSILTFMSSNIEEINKDNNHLKNLYKENMVYFSHASLLNNEEDDINLISNNKCYSMYKTVGYLDDNLCNIYVMDRFIYSRLNFSLSKGSNFSQKIEKGVITNIPNVKVNREYDILINEKKVKTSIKGILNKSSAYLSLSGGGTNLYSKQITKKSEIENGIGIIFICFDEIEDLQLRLDKCSSKIFIFEDFNNEFYKDYNILKEKGYAQTNKDFIKNDKKEIQMYIDYLLPIIIFIMILVLISLICITSISIIKDKKLFDIYKLIGCSKKELTIIILDYFLIIFFISFMINTFVELYLIDQGIIVSKESYIRALSLLLIVIVFSMFISLTITNKYIGVKSYDKN